MQRSRNGGSSRRSVVGAALAVGGADNLLLGGDAELALAGEIALRLTPGFR